MVIHVIAQNQVVKGGLSLSLLGAKDYTDVTDKKRGKGSGGMGQGVIKVPDYLRLLRPLRHSRMVLSGISVEFGVDLGCRNSPFYEDFYPPLFCS